MNPEWLEAPESPVQIQRPVNVQQGRLNQNERPWNSRLSLNRRGNQLIDLSSPTNENDDRRKRKSPPSVISIPGSSNLESRSNKKGKNVIQEVEVERFRGSTFRDHKGKGQLNVRPYNGGFQDISSDQPGLNSPPRRVGQRLLVRSGITSPSNTTRRNVAFNLGGTGPSLDAPKVGGEHNSRPAARDNKGKGKIDGNTSDVVIQEISPGQSSSSVPPRPIRQRYLVRNGVIAPRNIADRTAASNNGSTKEGESAPERNELEADQQLGLQPQSAVMMHESVGLGPQPAGSSYVGRAGEDALLSQIVADDSFGGVFRSRREIGAPCNSNASSSRSTQNNRPGRLNQTSTVNARHNPSVSAASINITARPFSGASSSTYRTRAIGAHPQRSRIGSLSSLNHAVSSSMTGNLETQATVTGRARGRIIPGRGVMHGPIIDVDEIPSPDFVSTARAHQLAYDEMIARQLQEELYNEVPGDWSMEEWDARIAISIQQEENAMHAPPIHQTSSRTRRSSRFIGLTDSDFNPHDYEALLALDEDNFHHTGASISQINSLPESIVKSCNSDESCAVCLETPSIGEKIRHLPCLHKFHKDCIDLWLQRKKECPICKCSTF